MKERNMQGGKSLKLQASLKNKRGGGDSSGDFKVN